MMPLVVDEEASTGGADKINDPELIFDEDEEELEEGLEAIVRRGGRVILIVININRSPPTAACTFLDNFIQPNRSDCVLRLPGEVSIGCGDYSSIAAGDLVKERSTCSGVLYRGARSNSRERTTLRSEVPAPPCGIVFWFGTETGGCWMGMGIDVGG